MDLGLYLITHLKNTLLNSKNYNKRWLNTIKRRMFRINSYIIINLRLSLISICNSPFNKQPLFSNSLEMFSNLSSLIILRPGALPQSKIKMDRAIILLIEFKFMVDRLHGLFLNIKVWSFLPTNKARFKYHSIHKILRSFKEFSILNISNLNLLYLNLLILNRH